MKNLPGFKKIARNKKCKAIQGLKQTLRHNN